MNYTEEHTSIVLVRSGTAMDSPWLILSSGRGKSYQLFTPHDAAKAVHTLPEGAIGCVFNVNALVAIATSMLIPVAQRRDVVAPSLLYASE